MLPADLSVSTENAAQARDDAREPPDRHIAAWRASLVDLTRSNPLLLLPIERDNPRLPGVTPDEMHDALSGRRSLLLAPGPSNDTLLIHDPARKRRVSLSLSEDRFSALEYLRRRARTTLQERGVTMLFAVLGILQWPDPQSPNLLLRSPVLLLPVVLERVPGVALLRLRRFDDETILNPALRAAWAQAELDVALPPIGDEPLEPKALLEIIQAAIADCPGWSLLLECSLGQFAPHAFAMAQDLDALAASVRAHPVAAALAGDTDAPARLPAVPLPALNELDAMPEHLHCVLEADPEQRLAILAARRGQSFVLHGPPGTGKSQTIANIAADSMAEGKTVLVVSHKTAALEAVATRLRGRGLATFCLEAYGAKAAKRSVLDQLRAALHARPTEGKSFDTDRQEADRLGVQLTQTVTALHAPRSSLGLSVYDVNGLAAGLQGAPDLPFVFQEPETVTAESYLLLETCAARLAEYSDVLGELAMHPWRGIRAEAFDEDLRRRVRSSLMATLDALEMLEQESLVLAREWHLDAPQSVDEIDRLIQITSVAQDTPHPPPAWLSLSQEERAGLLEEAHALSALSTPDVEQRPGDKHVAALHTAFGSVWQDKIMHSDSDLDAALSSVEEHLLKMRQGMTLLAESRHLPAPNTITETAELLSQAQSSGQAPSGLLAQSRSDFAALGEALRTFGTFLELTRLPFTDLALPQAQLSDLAQWIAELRDAVAQQRADPADQEARVAWSAQLALDPMPDWDQVLAMLAWTDRLCACFPNESLPAEFAALVCTAPESSLNAWIDQQIRVRLSRESLRQGFAPLQELFPPERLQHQGHTLEASRIKSFAAWLRLRLERLPDLERWLGWKALRTEGGRLGLSSFFETAAHFRPASDALVPAFRKRFYRLWLDAVLERDPLLRGLRGEEQNARIARFAALDGRCIDMAAEEVSALAQARRPTALFGVGEAALLRTQLHRRHPIPTRDLLSQVPNLLACLKPCLVMSPATVAQLLDPERIAFDLVIFDEASQIALHDAVGALLRARQVIVVGDRHQLPPNADFPAANGAASRDSNLSLSESIFDAADALASEESRSFARHALTRHYRSRDESLIAVSRRQFYPELLTFPAARDADAVTFEHLSSESARGDGEREDNPLEATRVADLVAAEIRRDAPLSIGVIAFCEAQRQAIEQALDRKRRAEPDLATLLDEDGPEGFFIKTCATAQGDVRDVVVLSVGYGLSADVLAAQRFGVLGRDGGDRLFNVAVTRARHRCIVVSTLLPSEIASERPGPRLLREYLRDAQAEAASSLAQRLTKTAPTLRAFEQAMESALTVRGHFVRRQVGISRQRVTLAVVDPDDPARYLLGIECDGPAYREEFTASQRDRCRERVLRARGWNLIRVWSSDWVRDPKTEIARIETALLSSQNSSASLPPPSAPPLPPGVTAYEKSAFTLAGGALDDEAAREEFLCSVIGLEGPLCVDAAAQRLASAAGLSGADARVYVILEETIDTMTEKGIVEQRDGFLWTRGARPPARVPRAGETPRPLEEIALEEMGEIALALLRAASTQPRAALVSETARVFGFPHANARTRERVQNAIALLEQESRVAVLGGTVRHLDLEKSRS